MQRRTALAVGGLILVLFSFNTSFLAPWRGSPRVIAHRGVHQTFSPVGVQNDTCTASRADPIEHSLLENTLPSMAAAFDAGADAVELDVHASSDGHLIVLHDATLDCRTDGHGAPEDHTLAEMRSLDLGYGYTADGGQTYPLRGRGVGLLVTLPEVYARFPGRRFVVDIKTNRVEDGDRVADVLAALADEDRPRQFVYGGVAAVQRVRERLPEVSTFDRGRIKACMLGYAVVGWTGWMPAACEHTLVLVPVNYAPLLWGFPRRLEARLEAVGSELTLMGPPVDGITTGVDDAQTLAGVPEDFGGWIWTNRVETIAPALHAR